MALVGSGLSQSGIQLLLTTPVAGRLYTVSLVDAPSDFLRYTGFLYVARLNPSIGRSAQLLGLPMWVKDTGITIPAASPATYRLVAAWRVAGLQWEVHDFT